MRSALIGKLGFTEDQSDHRRYVRVHDGRVVGLTYLSHSASGKDVTEGVVSAMAKQLKVPGPDFRGAVRCTVGRDAFLEILLKSRGLA
jgi:hypothetical protein